MTFSVPSPSCRPLLDFAGLLAIGALVLTVEAVWLTVGKRV